MPKNKLQIRNITVDFLVFTKDAREKGIEVRVQDNVVKSSSSTCVNPIMGSS